MTWRAVSARPYTATIGVLGGHLPTNGAPITLVVNFSEAVTGFSAAGVTVVSGGGNVTGVAGPADGAGGDPSYHAYMTAPVNSTGGTMEVRLVGPVDSIKYCVDGAFGFSA